MRCEIRQFKCLDDNFGLLVHDPATGATASIDVPEAAPVLGELAKAGWNLTHILVTHRHKDHIGGIAEVKTHYPNAKVIVPKLEAEQIGAYDQAVSDEDQLSMGSLKVKVLATPGHTIGHIVYWFCDEHLLFAGDMLFAMGCGRVFETPAPVMWDSLQKLAGLPPQTKIYCGHEYTLANGRFALAMEPGNQRLQERMHSLTSLRQSGAFTLPTTLADELATNPFLRADQPEIRQTLGMPNASVVDVFAELRARKNKF
jgi:hydroxyacylglutathione hydrolase